MLFVITGKHFEITEAVKNYAEQKTSKLLRHYNSINKIDVIVEGSEGGRSSVEIIASAEHNKIFVAKESGEDAYACISTAVRRLERQLRRKKEKERNNKHRT